MREKGSYCNVGGLARFVTKTVFLVVVRIGAWAFVCWYGDTTIIRSISEPTDRSDLGEQRKGEYFLAEKLSTPGACVQYAY